jgi:aspartyl-tRNA(Asn)/glutamyl-tRNA(Gln) amidotransferase subunit A
MDILKSSAAKLIAELSAKRISAREVAAAYLDRAKQVDSRIGAFLRLDADGILAQAKSIDDRRAKGEEVGALAGLPVAIKDVLCTKGEVTSCASKMLENFRPPYDATVIAKLRASGAVLFGKTNMDEFAMGGSTENSAFQLTRNPWNTNCIPGGSSGGAAACLAAQMACLSLGTDTGGSIRQPAGLCGVVGLKPTYGRVSRYGLVAFASSLDQIGPMATSAEDCAILLNAIAGHDPRDSTSAPVEVPDYAAAIKASIKGLKIGVIKEHFGEGLDAEVEAAVRDSIKVLQSLGATIEEISLPYNGYGIATYYVIAPCEASSNLARYDGIHYGYRTDEKSLIEDLDRQRKAFVAAGKQKEADDLDSALVRLYRKSRAEGFGPEVKRRIMLGTYALSAGYRDAYYVKALKVRRLIREDYDKALSRVDLLLGPVAPTPAFPIGAKTDDPLAMYLCDLYTVTTNLAGLPGISIPCGFSKAGLPIGLQLQGPAFGEAKLLQAAHQFQTATDWHTRRPNLS